MDPSQHRIQQLPTQLANQIAAGEVIERPASIVKELVENSIDAGATQIKIEIEGAGSQLIRVSDNGIGIHPDDLTLALSRHATSKIQSSEQLSHIASLGFRGEALPSISSVSQMLIRSHQIETAHGWQINGTSLDSEPTTHPIGTTIEVRDLFFNLPARRRFLRSDKTEQSHILATLHRLALSRFDIGFQYTLSAQQSIKLPALHEATQYTQRIAKICGTAFLKKAFYLDQQFEDMHLTGWLSHAEAHRAQTDIQYFFINGRIIRDRIINHAIRQAFTDHIPAGRHPAYVLYFTLPLDRVDINVHPTKHEVRFRDARRIHGLITRALQDALALDPARIQQATPSSTDNIAEHPQHYLSQLSASSSYEVPTVFGQLITLLHQQYAISQSDDALWLIDVQQADLSLRQQALITALTDGDLPQRPVLVPILLDVTPAQIKLLEHHVALLNSLGITAQIHTTATLKLHAIPKLLAQADLSLLMRDLIHSLEQDTPQKATLAPILLAHLTPQIFSHYVQAQQVLAQFKTRPTDVNWYRPLESKQLDRLLLAQI
jgi:DNA mismatch repair protein MutL